MVTKYPKLWAINWALHNRLDLDQMGNFRSFLDIAIYLILRKYRRLSGDVRFFDHFSPLMQSKAWHWTPSSKGLLMKFAPTMKKKRGKSCWFLPPPSPTVPRVSHAKGAFQDLFHQRKVGQKLHFLAKVNIWLKPTITTTDCVWLALVIKGDSLVSRFLKTTCISNCGQVKEEEQSLEMRNAFLIIQLWVTLVVTNIPQHDIVKKN